MTSVRDISIWHITHDMDERAGGIPAVVRQLSKQLKSKCIDNNILYANGDAGEVQYCSSVKCFPSSGVASSWCYSRGLRSSISEIIGQGRSLCNLMCHIHGVWSAPQYYGALEARRSSVPYLVSAHGMLEPWLWNKQGALKYLKKKLYWSTFAYPAFKHADVIHAITPLEKKHLVELFPASRIEVIPNAIHVPPLQDQALTRPSRRLLFLGRLEPKKGIHLLLEAFSIARIDSDWILDVVGPSWSSKYLSVLKSIVANRKLEKRVHFHDAVFAETKEKLIREAWTMIVPSYSEVVGLVNLEAAVNCTPTITTHETGLYNWADGGGMLVSTDIEAIATAIEDVCNWSADERVSQGLASRKLVEEHYSWQVVLPKWIKLYSSLV